MRWRAAIGVVLGGLALALAPTAAATHGCGLVRADSGTLAVDVFRGHARCSLAKRVIRIYFSGGGERHDGGSTATSYAIIGRWRCGSGTGGGGCIRGGADYTTAKDRVSGRFCGVVGSPRACRKGRSAAHAARVTSCRDQLLYQPAHGGYGLIIEHLRVRGISCRRGLHIAGAYYAGDPMPPRWVCGPGRDPGRTACHKDRAHALSFAFGGDAG